MQVNRYYLMEEASSPHALSRREAERWIAAALAEAEALHEHDEQALPSDPSPAELAQAERFHLAWNRWADNVERLMDHVRESLHRSMRLQLRGWHDLRLEHSVARSITERSPQAHADLLRGLRDGTLPTFGVDELREKLRNERAAAGELDTPIRR